MVFSKSGGKIIAFPKSERNAFPKTLASDMLDTFAGPSCGKLPRIYFNKIKCLTGVDKTYWWRFEDPIHDSKNLTPTPQSLTVPPWKVTFPRGKDRPPTTIFLGLCQTSGVYWTLTTQRLRCLSFHFSSLGKVCLARFLKSTFWVHSIAIDTGEKSRPCKTHGLFRWWDGWQTWQKNSIFLVQKNLP